MFFPIVRIYFLNSFIDHAYAETHCRHFENVYDVMN